MLSSSTELADLETHLTTVLDILEQRIDKKLDEIRDTFLVAIPAHGEDAWTTAVRLLTRRQRVPRGSTRRLAEHVEPSRRGREGN